MPRTQAEQRRADARLRVMQLASRLGALKDAGKRGTPEWWDAFGAVHDARALLCIAKGIPVEQIDRNGYDARPRNPAHDHQHECDLRGHTHTWTHNQQYCSAGKRIDCFDTRCYRNALPGGEQLAPVEPSRQLALFAA